ncbi:venom allergen 3-like [Trichogramma pretiosum]|uniref:venom allergen 3-like n=1 Tax=Trichogramma pretiosum TaxID=7493 RepID=UPI0006C9DF03|nr:venom allergen 3-like [Trichogramma pretiosum]
MIDQKSLFLAFICCAVVVSAADYCHLYSCQYASRPEHVMCAHPTGGASPVCKQVISSGLSEDEKKRIVDLHNELRAKVARGEESRGSPGPQPKASDMKTMVWDDELATIAQRWADQCSMKSPMCNDVERFQVNQNAGTSGTTGDVNNIQVENIVRMWYNNVQYYDKNDVASFKRSYSVTGKPVGTYTQIVWGETDKIGCGVVRHKPDRFNHVYLVCNYGPAGNRLGEPVYKVQ